MPREGATIKRRISVTVTESYLQGMNSLIEKGIYLDRGEIVTEGIRIILGSYGVASFTDASKQR